MSPRHKNINIPCDPQGKKFLEQQFSYWFHCSFIKQRQNVKWVHFMRLLVVPILSLHYKVDKINNASFMRKEGIIKHYRIYKYILFKVIFSFPWYTTSKILKRTNELFWLWARMRHSTRTVWIAIQVLFYNNLHASLNWRHHCIHAGGSEFWKAWKKFSK